MSVNIFGGGRNTAVSGSHASVETLEVIEILIRD